LYSLLFHGLFAVFLLLLAAVALISGTGSFWFEILPWSGEKLAWWLLGLAVGGLLFVFLAWRGKLNGLFLLWTLVVLALVVRGYFFSDYMFSPGTDQFRNALLIIGGALLAVIGARDGAGRRSRTGLA
jgi:hypothetical protein